MLLDMRADHLKIVHDILQKHVPEREVWAFGSRAKWLAKEYSDLDLCILGETPLSFTTLGLMAEAFDESDLPYKVDLVDWATTSESFRKIMERDRVVVQKVRAGRGIILNDAWEKLTLKEAGVTLIDCDHRTPSATDVGYPYIAIPQLKDGRVSLDGVRLISKSDYVDWTKKLAPQADDVIVVRRCNSGQTAYIPSGFKCAIGQNLVVLRSDGTKVFPQYLRWLVRGAEWWDEVGKFINVGAVFDSLRCRDIPNFELPIPPIEAQREIAEMLASIDDRITLLRETNATLEAIAQALFKSWFMDFDPVRAKMEGRAPEGMDEATAALFPDSFEETELGRVPKGWGVGAIDSLASLNPESWGAKQHPERIHYVDLANTKANEINGVTEFSFDDAPSRARRVLRFGDVIVGTVRPGNRSFARIAQDVTGLTGSTGFAVLRARQEFDQALVYIAATRDEAIERLAHLADGGAYPAVRPEVVASTPLTIPPKEVRIAFGEVANALFASIGANQACARLLADMRDTLLPRLISGQLRLPEARAELEAVDAL